MDVENDDICWNIFVAESICRDQNLFVWIITITTLLISKAPQWRHLHSSREVCVMFNNSRYTVIEDEVIIHFTCIGGKTCKSIIRCTEIEIRLIGVVKKYPIGEVVMNAHVKRNGAIEWIGIWSVGKIICIIIFVAMPSSVQRTCFFSQSYKSFAILKLFVRSNLFTIPTC